MTEIRCDVCGVSMDGQTELVVTLYGVKNKKASRTLRIEVVPGENDGDMCNDCMLDALYALRTPLPDLEEEAPPEKSVADDKPFPWMGNQ
jgi:hypothetical protein